MHAGTITVKEGEKIEDSLVFESEPDKGKKMKVPADETFKEIKYK